MSSPPSDRRPPATAPAIRIRPAVAADRAAIVELENSVFTLDRVSERQWRRHLASPSAQVLVAVRAGRVLGAALILHRRGSTVSRLYSIAVAPAERGQRIGDRLLEAAERAARRRGSTAVRLEVRVENLPAQRLYERSGWRRFGLHRAYYEDGQDALRYEKSLS